MSDVVQLRGAGYAVVTKRIVGKLDLARVPPGQPELDRAVVKDLADSISEVGLLNQPNIRELSDDYELVAGRHRLAALKMLGHDEVEYVVLDLDAARAELARIAENGHRKHLRELDLSLLIARYRALRNQIRSDEIKAQPGPKRGRPPTGIGESAEVFGLSITGIKDRSRVAGLSEEAQEKAKQLGLDDNLTALKRAAANGTSEQQIRSLEDKASSKPKSTNGRGQQVRAPAPSRSEAAPAPDAAASSEILPAAITLPTSYLGSAASYRLEAALASYDALIPTEIDEFLEARHLRRASDDGVQETGTTCVAENCAPAPTVDPSPIPKTSYEEARGDGCDVVNAFETDTSFHVGEAEGSESPGTVDASLGVVLLEKLTAAPSDEQRICRTTLKVQPMAEEAPQLGPTLEVSCRSSVGEEPVTAPAIATAGAEQASLTSGDTAKFSRAVPHPVRHEKDAGVERARINAILGGINAARLRGENVFEGLDGCTPLEDNET